MNSATNYITAEVIGRVLDAYPTLGVFGFNAEATAEERDAARVHFVRNIDEVRRAALWLSQLPATKKPTSGSYGLKHAFESVSGDYCANGTIIIAALACGIAIAPDDRGPNADIAVKPRR